MSEYQGTTNSAVPTETQSRNVVPASQTATTAQQPLKDESVHPTVNTQDNRGDASNAQEIQGMNQVQNPEQTQDNGSSDPENWNHPTDQGQDNESGQSQTKAKNENDKSGEGEKMRVEPKNTGGTKEHIKEQPDQGQLGGLTGKQPVGKIDLHNL
ncbi:hypothetical protein Unana1_06046 [Umbelopsis nana]